MKKLMCLFLGSVMVLMLGGHAQAELVVVGKVGYEVNGKPGRQPGEYFNLIWEKGADLIWLDFTQSQRTGYPKQTLWARTLETGASQEMLDQLFEEGKLGQEPVEGPLPALDEIQWNEGYTVNWTDNSWRLPTTDDQTAGYNITGSEMGHLFYEVLGNSAYTEGGGDINTGLFQHLHADDLNDWYWSGTEQSSASANAWRFNMFAGLQGATKKRRIESSRNLAIAVRSAEVSPVPVPETGLLLALGLGGMAVFGRRKERE